MLQDRVSDCTFAKYKHPDCLTILHVRKIYFAGLFLIFFGSMLRTGSYVKQIKSIQIFNPSSVIYMRAHVNSSTIANIIGIDTKIEVIVASPTTWEAHHSPRAKPEGCGELPRSLVTQQ